MTHSRGFSLLELSIGLIAGGIVAGAAMIRAAELRALITEQEQYKTAVNTFRDKYLGLPGDLKAMVLMKMQYQQVRLMNASNFGITYHLPNSSMEHSPVPQVLVVQAMPSLEKMSLNQNYLA